MRYQDDLQSPRQTQAGNPKSGTRSRREVGRLGERQIHTFHLRKSVKFYSNDTFMPSHNFNADDALYTFNRQSKATNPCYKLANASY